MRYIDITHSGVQLDEATETFLLSELEGLRRECDSVHSCRVHLQGGSSSPERSRPFCVTLLLSTGEHHIVVKSCDGSTSTSTARDTISDVIGEAANELRKLKSSSDCATCSGQSAGTSESVMI